MLALLVALATATVLAAAAGARRAQTAVERLWTGTLPTTVTVLANQPGFDWGKVRALPEVAAVSEFPVTFGFALPCCPDAGTGFPPIGDEYGRTIERPYMLAGRMFDPARADEVMVTPQFAAAYHKGVGDTLTLLLASPSRPTSSTTGPRGRHAVPPSRPGSSGWAAALAVHRVGRTGPEGRRAGLAGPVRPLPGQHPRHQRADATSTR